MKYRTFTLKFHFDPFLFRFFGKEIKSVAFILMDSSRYVYLIANQLGKLTIDDANKRYSRKKLSNQFTR